MSGVRGDARKRQQGEHLTHWDAGVRAVIEREVAKERERIDAALTDPETREFVIRWLYNGPQGHQGPPPPREALDNLDCDAANALDAIRALLAREVGQP